MPEESSVVVQAFDKGSGLKRRPCTREPKVSSETSLVGVGDSVGVVEAITQEVAKSREVLKVLSGGGDKLG